MDTKSLSLCGEGPYFKYPLVNKQAMGKTSDQIIEHSYIDRMLNKLKMADSVKTAKKQHDGIFVFTFCSCSVPLNVRFSGK